MKRTEKLSILISIVLISLLAISAVNAADADDAIGAVSTDDAPAVADAQDTTTIAKESSSPEPVKEAETKAVAADEPQQGTFNDLNTDINGPYYSGEKRDETRINLTRDYQYNSEIDTQYMSGVSVKPSPIGGNTLIINGNGHTITANNMLLGGKKAEGIFVLDNGINLVLENLILIQSQTAVTVNNATSSLTTENVTFMYNDVAISNELGGSLEVDDSTFINNIESIISVGDLTIPDQKPDTEPDEDSFLSFFDVKIVNSIFKEGDYGEAGLLINNSAVFISNSTFEGFNDMFEDLNAAILAMNSLLAIGDNTTFVDNFDSIVMNNTGLIMNKVKFIDGGVSIIANNTPILIMNNTVFKNNYISMDLNNTLLALINHVAFIGYDDEDMPGEEAIFAKNTIMTMYETVFINNTGAIFAQNSKIFANKTAFINNKDKFIEGDFLTASIIGYDTNIEVYDSLFLNNSGAIDVENATLNISNTTFINNTNNAIWTKNATVNIEDSIFKGNNAIGLSSVGGAINVADENTNLTVVNTKFIDNIADEFGGAIYNNGNTTIVSSEFINNNVNYHFGGAIYNNGTLKVSSTFKENRAEIGGAIYSKVEAIIKDSEFIKNRAKAGGAIYNLGNAEVNISYFEENKVTQTGGAICTEVQDETIGKTIITYSLFKENSAGLGGAINNNGNTTVTNSTFEYNTATIGGAICNMGDIDTYAMVIMDNEFKNDYADNGSEIYTYHEPGSYYGHTRSIKLVGNTISNNIFEEKDDLVLIGCKGCIEDAFNEIYKHIINYNATILNNNEDKVVLYFTLYEEREDGEPYFNEPLLLTINGEVNVTAFAFEPLIFDEKHAISFEPGEYTIEVEYDVLGAKKGKDTIYLNVTKSVKKLEEQLEEDNKTITNLTEAVDELTGKLIDADLKIENLTTTLNTTNNTLQHTQGLLEETTYLYENAVKALDNATKQLNETNNTLTKTKADLDKANSDLVNKTNEVNAAQAQVTQLNNELKAAKSIKISKIKAPKSIKKSKKLVIQVTLNQKIKGKKVYVIFKGKLYTGKTNAKGLAKITIKKSALKKLGGKKVKYQIIYDQQTKNQSVKIKK